MIYIHVPFCKSRCIYCDFFSTTHDGAWQQKYVDALVREIKGRREEIVRAQADTIYIGGGTPSLLPADFLLQIFDVLGEVCGGFASLGECTIEANPNDVTKEWTDALRGTPVNRVSMGVQSLNDDMLKQLRRRHTAAQALEAVTTLRERGYNNLSLDLMYGLPGQSQEEWEGDVRDILAVGAPHLSAYALQVEEGTLLYRNLEEGIFVLPEEDETVAMYESLMRLTAAAGLEHYEISNFARLGFRAQHNSGYWSGRPYVGLGPGAHSYDGGRVRRSNTPDLGLYCEAGEPCFEQEILTDEERYNEMVLTRLRTSDGLDIGLLKENERNHTLNVARKHIESGVMSLKNGILRLESKGIFVSNDIISDFML